MNYGKIDTNKFMTLENTVDLLVEAVNQHYDVDRVLADFGIKILGRVNSTSDIPGYTTGQYYGKFGDAYLVSHNADGVAPFDVYIWTRLSATAVEPNGYWLDIGFLSTIGPQGAQGIQGPEGPAGESSRWYVSSSVPLGNYNQGDMLLLTNGDVYSYGTSGWGNPVANIKGDDGTAGTPGFTPYIENGYWFINGVNTNVKAEGKAGANGTPGTAIIIVGKRDSVDDLPTAATQPRNHGYLISVNDVVRLYFIAGIEGEESWEYIDYSGNGTIVTTDGTAVDTWETDTKADKITDPNKIYATDTDGNQTSFAYSYSALANTIPLRSGGGNINVAETPLSDISAASKKYVDTVGTDKVSKITVPSSVYIIDANGSQSSLQYSADAINNTIAIRNSNGEISVATPTADNSAANKAYVDGVVGNKVTRLTSDGTEKIYAMNSSGEDVGLSLSSEATPNTVAKRDSAGSIIVPTPTSNNQAASKQYVDTAIANSGGTGTGGGENLDTYINQAIATATANKVDKLTNDGTEKVYAMNTSGEDTSIPVATRATANSIVKCDENGKLLDSQGSEYVTTTAVSTLVNVAIANKVDKLTNDGTEKVYAMNTSGEDVGLSLSSEATSNTIAKRDSAGSIVVPTPTSNNQAASKQYVDTAIANSGGGGGGGDEDLDEYINQAVATATANKVDKLTNDGTEKIYTMNSSGEDTSIPVVTRSTANSIVKCDQYGQLISRDGNPYTSIDDVNSYITQAVYNMYKKISLYQDYAITGSDFPSGGGYSDLYSYKLTFYAPNGFSSDSPILFMGDNFTGSVNPSDFYGVSPIDQEYYNTKVITFTCYKFGDSNQIYMIGDSGIWYIGQQIVFQENNEAYLYISLLWNGQ